MNGSKKIDVLAWKPEIIEEKKVKVLVVLINR